MRREEGIALGLEDICCSVVRRKEEDQPAWGEKEIEWESWGAMEESASRVTCC